MDRLYWSIEVSGRTHAELRAKAKKYLDAFLGTETDADQIQIDISAVETTFGSDEPLSYRADARYGS